jgi:predicted transcriptional regulator
MVSILQLIQDETVAADIARTLDISRSHVSYYIKKARERGFINQITRDSFAVLQVTQPGKNFLDQYDKNQLSIPICRAENIRFKAVITQMPTLPVDWKKIEMHNWTQYSSQIDGVKVRLNTGVVPILELLPSPVDGNDPYELFTINVCECYNVLLDLHDKIGLKVANLQLGSRGEWLVYDPIARAFCKHNGQVNYAGIAKVNASKPRNIGEFEFHDPRALKDYLMMPYRLKNIEKQIRKIMEQLEQN